MSIDIINKLKEERKELIDRIDRANKYLSSEGAKTNVADPMYNKYLTDQVEIMGKYDTCLRARIAILEKAIKEEPINTYGNIDDFIATTQESIY